MAEIPDRDANQEVATGESAPTSERTQREEIPESTIEDVLSQVLDSRLGPMQQQFDRRLTPLEQLRARVEYVITSNQRLEHIVRGIAKGSLSEEDQQNLEQIINKGETESELKRTKERADKAETDAKALTQVALEARQQGAWEQVLASVEEKGRAEGFTDRETLVRLMPKDAIPGRGDPFGYIRVAREWKAGIEAEADRRSKASESKPVIVQERGAAPPGGYESYTQALKAGSKLPSQREIDEMTAAWMAQHS